jgi:hypothetical protein
MKKLNSLGLALLWAATVLCQSPATVASSVARLNQINRSSGLIPYFNLRYDGIKGSKFFYDNYTEGEVWMSKDRHYGKEYTYKFDEEENTVQIRQKDGKEISLLSFEIEVVKLYIDSSTVTYFRAEVPNSKGEHRLFQVLFVGKTYTLLKLPGKRMVKEDRTGGYNTGEIYHEYVPTHRYFLLAGQKPAEELKMTKRSLMKSLPQKKALLEAFFETHEGDIQDYEIAELLEKSEKEK